MSPKLSQNLPGGFFPHPLQSFKAAGIIVPDDRQKISHRNGQKSQGRKGTQSRNFPELVEERLFLRIGKAGQKRSFEVFVPEMLDQEFQNETFGSGAKFLMGAWGQMDAVADVSGPKDDGLFLPFDRNSPEAGDHGATIRE
jgi:hypothetical protein